MQSRDWQQDWAARHRMPEGAELEEVAAAVD
jgi:hypothetical protein